MPHFQVVCRIAASYNQSSGPLYEERTLGSRPLDFARDSSADRRFVGNQPFRKAKPALPSFPPTVPITTTNMADKEKDGKKKSRKERQRELRMLEKEISGGKSLIDYGKVNQVRAFRGGMQPSSCWCPLYCTIPYRRVYSRQASLSCALFQTTAARFGLCGIAWPNLQADLLAVAVLVAMYIYLWLVHVVYVHRACLSLA